MRSLVVFLVVVFPCIASATVPSTPKPRVAAVDLPIRVSLVNFSSHNRQVRSKSGFIELPSGQRVDIDSHVGATLQIVSSTDVSLHEEIRLAVGDDRHILSVQ